MQGGNDDCCTAHDQGGRQDQDGDVYPSTHDGPRYSAQAEATYL